ARQFGIQELSTTVLTTTIVGIGFDSRIAGGGGHRQKLRFSVVLTMCAGALVGATMTRWVVAPVIGTAAAVVALAAAIFRFGSDRREDSAGESRRMPSVLVTGASRGIGKSIVEHLAARGWDVIAGVRNERDAAAVIALNPQQISSVILDVTDARDIAALSES